MAATARDAGAGKLVACIGDEDTVTVRLSQRDAFFVVGGGGVAESSQLTFGP